ncbi:DUF6691 family protein [Flavobacterium sp.]|jgi:uncharacterized protein|uniref:DUF6691 family protein n=1 Tax=Flavobacterium sp. TaxID=239 RepID=UPI003F6963BE
MKFFKFLFVGFVFGVVLTKSEAISWFRIFEMFRFESFHMYGIIMIAISTGIIGIQLIKKYKIKDVNNNPILIPDKEKGFYNYFIGGIIFGLGWAMVGCCPGPIFILIGTGAFTVVIVLLGAILGTYLYGILRKKLPH